MNVNTNQGKLKTLKSVHLPPTTPTTTIFLAGNNRQPKSILMTQQANGLTDSLTDTCMLITDK